jgi:hypothetical protein
VINIESIVIEVLQENANVAGGPNSVLGAGVTSTSSQFSGDSYARGDARVPKVLGGIIRRNKIPTSIYGKGSKSLKYKRKHKRRHKRRR